MMDLEFYNPKNNSRKTRNIRFFDLTADEMVAEELVMVQAMVRLMVRFPANFY
jgi:hypothetical protein